MVIAFAVSSANSFAQMNISYGVPEGFSPAELDEGARYLGTFNGVTLPDFITPTPGNDRLTFDRQKYADNGVAEEDIATLKSLLTQFDYSDCERGCDVTLAGYRIALDKLRRTLAVHDSHSDFVAPDTHFGLVHNQSVDLRASSDRYRAMNLNGNAWLGLPSRAFGYLNWYSGSTTRDRQRTQTQGVSSWYLQKNFQAYYLRAGKQSSADFAAGTITTLLTPGFDLFATLGSQTYLQNQDESGALVLFSAAEGNYEFYRQGRMILKRHAVLGRNEISYADLPGGYYPLEIRLVDRDGRLINTDIQEVSNIQFGSGQQAWNLTVGQEAQTRLSLLRASLSHDMHWFFMNSSLLSGQRGKWAGEVNLTRPMPVGDRQLTPTLGLLSGEARSGGYASLSTSSATAGSLTVSHYLNNRVSGLYQGSASTSLSYSRQLGDVTLSYRYLRYVSSRQQQVEARWNYRPGGVWATFSLGIQNGGYQLSSGNYGLYFNTSWSLSDSQASFSAARSGGETQLSGDYRKTFHDDFGETTAGTTVSRADRHTSASLYASRSGARGSTSLNVGQSEGIAHADFNYRGMVAASSQGMALGSYSDSGAAMLLETPTAGGLPYRFSVENTPVTGGHRYAVPLKTYADIPFAQVVSESRDMDINVEVPANIVRAHPGQVYSARASVDVSLLYHGFMKDRFGKPVSGTIEQTGDAVYANGLFSITSKTLLSQVTVRSAAGRYLCDLTRPGGVDYPCQALNQDIIRK